MKEFKHKSKGKKPVIAICYDFDKTLTPTDMQAQGFIQDMGYDVKDFWTKSNSRAADNGMDENLSYMLAMIEVSKGKKYITRKALAEYGERIELYRGVKEWFERIRAFGKRCGVTVEHYVISSGLKEMIEGTEPAKAGAFEEIYASEFYYDENKVAVWPSQVVNFTNKTQFLFRIEKGVPDKNDPSVNDYFPPEAIRVPFTNMIYIGDSDTDVPCMKLIDSSGGHSIGVYNPETKDKSKVYKMIKEKRIKFFAAADYSEGGELCGLVKSIIRKVAATEVLTDKYYKNNAEAARFYAEQSEEARQKRALIYALDESRSFSSTHTVMSELKKHEEFSQDDIAELLRIGAENPQVYCIMGDRDVAVFYKKLLKLADIRNESVNKAKDDFIANLALRDIPFD